MMKFMKSIGFLLTLTSSIFAEDKPGSPTEAQVTFYSAGSFWKSVEPGYKHGVFRGWVLDNEQPLAELKGGRFVTFRFLPGEHTFSANYWVNKSAKGGAHLKMDLKPGQHYFVSTYLNERPLVLVSIPLIEQRSCQEAQKDAAAVKPLPSNAPEKAAAPYLVNEISFPQCS